MRDGHLEAPNHFFGMPGQDEELELTSTMTAATMSFGTGHGHITIGVDDLDGTLARLREWGIEPEREHYRVREAVRGCVASEIRASTASS